MKAIINRESQNGKRTIEIEVTYTYTLEVDDQNAIVKEYDTECEMLDDITSYRFDVLPVLQEGVKVKEVSLVRWKHA